MDDVTRRQVIKAAASAGAVATGAVGLAASSVAQEQRKGKDGQGGEVRRFSTTEIVCKNFFGNLACLNLVSEDREHFFEVRYRGNKYRNDAVWVRIAETQQDIGMFGIIFEIRISEVNINGPDFSARVRLQARARGQAATIIDERISVRYFIPSPTPGIISGQEEPFVTYGEEGAQEKNQ